MPASSLLLTDARHLEWVAEELPPLGPHDILVQTRTGAISIGSELPHYCGTSRGNHPTTYPRMTGYESVGTVLACGDQVQRIQAGDRVVAFYGHRTHAVVPEGKAIVIPDDISDALAILTILSCDAAKGVRKLSPAADERALITGAGTIGLLTLFILKACGIASVDVVEPRVERHALARELGASNVLLPQAMDDASAGYTLGFECSSRDAAFALLQRHMRQDGRICITADGNLEPLTLTPAFHEKELRLVASSDGWDYHEHAAWYFREVREHPINLEQLFEVRITSGELIATFEQLATGEIQPVKVLIDYTRP